MTKNLPLKGRGGTGLGTIALIGTNPWVMQQRENFSIGTHDVCAILLLRNRRLTQLSVEWVGVGTMGIVGHLPKQAFLRHERSPSVFLQGH
jgi:hypothetical protein